MATEGLVEFECNLTWTAYVAETEFGFLLLQPSHTFFLREGLHISCRDPKKTFRDRILTDALEFWRQ